MDPEKRREAAAKGGRRAHETGAAFEWDSRSGAAAGRKGGAALAKKNREKRAAERSR